MANEIDELMDLDPLELTSQNIDAIIAHHRKARANAAAGIKVKKETGPKIDISSVVLGMTRGESAEAKPQPTVRRR